MHHKKLVVALATTAIVASGVFVAFHVHQSTTMLGETSPPAGVINPDQATVGLKTRAQPQLSDQRFEPQPTITTGTYTDPNYRKESVQQDATKKNATAR